MTTTELTGTHAEQINADALKLMRKHLEGRHSHMIVEARAKIREMVRTEFCEMFNVAREERADDDGGGSVSLTFPPDWTEDQATRFASDFLDLDLGSSYNGPGSYFQNSGVSRLNATGEVFIGISWGLDI